MNRLKSIGFVVLAAAITVGLALQVAPVLAEGSAALSITPKKNYNIKAGKSISDTLTIRNLDKEKPLNLSLRVVDFTYTDEGGTPKLMLAEDAPQTTWSLKPFLKITDRVTIDPSSSQTIDMDIAIPKGQGAGDFYSAIVYSSSDSEGGNVGLSASGVTLVFTGIPGKVDEKLTLEKLGAYDSAEKKFRYFNGEKPREIGYKLRNEGNVTESPVGSLTLKNWFGHEIVINDINPNGSLALIGQTRTFESCIKQMKEEMNFNGTRTEATACAEPTMWPGYYGVDLDAFYGQNGNNTQDLVGRAGFWYLPWWSILIFVAVVSFVSYHTWRIVRYFKQRKSSGKFKKRTTTRRK